MDLVDLFKLGIQIPSISFSFLGRILQMLPQLVRSFSVFAGMPVEVLLVLISAVLLTVALAIKRVVVT